MKALEKDRARRYETANGLALDVQRYLANEVISARPPSRVYKFRKLVSRNKLLFAGIRPVSILLITSLALVTASLREARTEAAKCSKRPIPEGYVAGGRAIGRSWQEHRNVEGDS